MPMSYDYDSSIFQTPPSFETSCTGLYRKIDVHPTTMGTSDED